MNLVRVIFYSRQSGQDIRSSIMNRAIAAGYVEWLREVSFVENIRVIGALDGKPILN